MKRKVIGILLFLVLCFCGCTINSTSSIISIEEVPAFSGEPYVEINNNKPYFIKEDFQNKSFERYSQLDTLGRCGTAFANVGIDTMPTEKRGAIGHVKPTGWQSKQYDFVDGKNLYNRCHLIGYQLTAENANKENLITGTRYMNVEGMLPFENMVADYVKETQNHVLYRVTPDFQGDELVARGVQIEAESVEDSGKGIQFHVYVYNVQPGVGIHYTTGESWQEGQFPSSEDKKYILNKGTKKFHQSECESVQKISPKNRKTYIGTRQKLIDSGYSACGQCKP